MKPFGFGTPKRKPSYAAGAVQSSSMAMPGQEDEFDALMAQLNPGGIKAPKSKGMGFGGKFNPLRFDPDKGVGEGNRLYAIGAMLSGMGTGDPGLTAQLLEPKLQQNRERVAARDEEAQRQAMLQQLGQMPGVTDQQRTLLGMGIGADQLAQNAFAPPEAPAPFQSTTDALGRPTPFNPNTGTYGDPFGEGKPEDLPEGMRMGPNGPEYIPAYVDTQERLRRAGASSVSVDMGTGPQENAFMKEAGSLEAKNFGSLVEMGQTSRRNRVILDQLDTEAAAIPGGLEAVAKNALGNLGIPVEGLSEIQATEALINQLVPAQRQPGSGDMSDRDLALFKASLPRLIQTTEGKTRILTNMKAINDYVISEGEIASRVLSGKLTPEQGRAEMQALGNPLAGDPRTGQPTGPQGADLQGLMAPDGDPVTEEDVAETMRKYNVTREQVIAHLRGQ